MIINWADQLSGLQRVQELKSLLSETEEQHAFESKNLKEDHDKTVTELKHKMRSEIAKKESLLLTLRAIESLMRWEGHSQRIC